MPPIKIDLYSDTVTRPTAPMRKFMSEAEVGDEQKFEDPTVNRLQERVAELLGKEAGLYLPSGTMCNQIAFRIHCRPGDEVLLHRSAHPVISEAGGLAALSSALPTGLEARRGVFAAEQVRAAIRPLNRYAPRTRVVSIEQTSNSGGGTPWSVEAIGEVAAVAREHGLILHMDGARLFNAVVATGTPARDFAAPFDTVWVDFSKGLGAPVGAVLAGRRELIEEAWVWKQRLGGAMRQAGIIAAGGLYALEHHIERLAEDHANAKLLAEGLAEIPGVTLDPAEVETNIVIFEVSEAAAAVAGRLLEQGVRVSQPGPHRLRAVTHLDIARRDVEGSRSDRPAVFHLERPIAGSTTTARPEGSTTLIVRPRRYGSRSPGRRALLPETPAKPARRALRRQHG